MLSGVGKQASITDGIAVPGEKASSLKRDARKGEFLTGVVLNKPADSKHGTLARGAETARTTAVPVSSIPGGSREF